MRNALLMLLWRCAWRLGIRCYLQRDTRLVGEQDGWAVYEPGAMHLRRYVTR